MSFEPRSIPIDPDAKAALAAKGLDYRLIDPGDIDALDGWIEADHRGFHHPRPRDVGRDFDRGVMADRRIHGVFDDTIAPELKNLAPPPYLERARLLAAAMRVVYLLTAAMPGVMPRLGWTNLERGVLALVIPAALAGLYGERLEGRLAQLARIAGRKLQFSVAEC